MVGSNLVAFFVCVQRWRQFDVIEVPEVASYHEESADMLKGVQPVGPPLAAGRSGSLYRGSYSGTGTRVASFPIAIKVRVESVMQ